VDAARLECWLHWQGSGAGTHAGRLANFFHRDILRSVGPTATQPWCLAAMPRFTMDNTKGYTQAQLDELNDRFEGVKRRLERSLGRELDPSDLQDGSTLDYFAECILARELDEPDTKPQ
jgi:hypothetical protein